MMKGWPLPLQAHPFYHFACKVIAGKVIKWKNKTELQRNPLNQPMQRLLILPHTLILYLNSGMSLFSMKVRSVQKVLNPKANPPICVVTLFENRIPQPITRLAATLLHAGRQFLAPIQSYFLCLVTNEEGEPLS